MVFLHARGGHRVDAGRRGESAILGDQRRGRVLGDHQPGVHPGLLGEKRRQALRAVRIQQTVDAALGDRPDLRGGDGQKIRREGERLAMEVAIGLDLAAFEDDRVVDGR